MCLRSKGARTGTKQSDGTEKSFRGSWRLVERNRKSLASIIAGRRKIVNDYRKGRRKLMRTDSHSKNKARTLTSLSQFSTVLVCLQ